MIVFGGAIWQGRWVETNEVWSLSLDDLRWTRLTPGGPEPPGRFYHSAVYDPDRDRMLVFGGTPYSGEPYTDTWALSLGGHPRWSRIEAGGEGPPARSMHGAIYDSRDQRMLVCGGQEALPGPFAPYQTWELSLRGRPSWRMLDPGIVPQYGRRLPAAAYDPDGDRMLIGTLGDLWSLEWDRLNRHESQGRGRGLAASGGFAARSNDAEVITPGAERVEVRLYDVAGRLVLTRTVSDAAAWLDALRAGSAGEAAGLTPGVYFAINSPAGIVGSMPAQAVQTISSWGFPVTEAAMHDLAQKVGEVTLFNRTGGAPSLAVGMAHIFSNVLGGSGLMAIWYHFAIMFEALFILTTIDAGTRISRYLFQETAGKLYPKFGEQNWWPGAIFATFVVTAGWGALVWTGQIATIWPMFGIANQLLAVLALALVTTWLINSGRKRYAWVTIVPMLFVRPEMDLPIVPIMTNCVAPPLPPAERFYQVGKILREVIDEIPSEKRIGVVVSGNLSLEVGGPLQFDPKPMDEEFDDQAVKWISEGDIETALRVCTFDRMTGAGNVTHAFVNFLLAMALAKDMRCTYAEGLKRKGSTQPFFAWEP